ncbi:hypothetical protein [Streptomyces lienomycini]|uniref:hypothetical protein n=1 Tax=Streptomyces lienomycini TaxID=284035 RepID=UPI0036403D64
MFKRDPERAAEREAKRAEKRQQREEWAAKRKAEKAALAEWRQTHPALKHICVYLFSTTTRDKQKKQNRKPKKIKRNHKKKQ